MQIAARKAQDTLPVDIAGRMDARAVGDAGDQLTAIGETGEQRVVLILAGVE